MKIKKFNKKEYFAVAASFVLVAAVGVGLSSAIGDKGATPPPPKTNIATVPPITNEAHAVDSSKNAPAKTDDVETLEKSSVKDSPTQNIDNTKSPAEEEKETVFEDEFDEVALMENEIVFAWPIKGDIALDFSTDKTVFDPTLEQFRTNDSVCILANEGTQVKAAGDGIVANIFTDYEKGVTIVINHADGWSTTYSQLNEEATVAVGETVKKGELIGKVAKPTKFSSALGTHLEFKFNQGQFAIDPKVAIN